MDMMVICTIILSWHEVRDSQLNADSEGKDLPGHEET